MNHYNKMLLIAESNGLTSKDLDRAMISVAGKYSSMTDNEIRTIIQPQIESICEPIYESQGAEAFNECTKKLVEEYRIKELRKSRSKTFWSSVGSFLGGLTSSREDSSAPSDSAVKDSFRDKDDEKDKTILGMKPLTFTLVSVLTVTALTVGIIFLTRKK